MTARQTKKWTIVDAVSRVTHHEIIVCASPKATPRDILAFAMASLPSRAVQGPWTLQRSRRGLIARCGLTRGFRHYLITAPRKETTE